MRNTVCLCESFCGSRLTLIRTALTFALGVLLFFLCPISADAELTYNAWYPKDMNVAISKGECGAVYKLTMTDFLHDYQVQLTLDGSTDITPSNTVIASDLTGWSFYSSDGKAYALKCTSDLSGDTDIYLSTIKNADGKYTLSSTVSYDVIGIEADTYENITNVSTTNFTSVFCSSSNSTLSGTYQWQVKKKGETEWTDISGLNDAVCEIEGVIDSAYYRLVNVNGVDTVFSNEIQTTYKVPTLDFEVSNVESFNSYEKEMDNNNSFTVTVNSTEGLFTLSSYRLDVYNNGTKIESLTSASNEISYTPALNCEYVISAVGTDQRPGKEGNPVDVSAKFFVRLRYSSDSASVLDTLWYDDFGRFVDATSFQINDTVFSGTLTDVNGVTNQILGWWAPDYYGSVYNESLGLKAHNYVLNDPLVGPFNVDDCSSDGYQHYACWKGCNGYRVEDGYYAILSNPMSSNGEMPEKDYWNGTDHSFNQTGDVNGGMLFVNCKGSSYGTVIYQRDINLPQSCDNTQLLFNAYINNATLKTENAPVNVRLDVRDEDNNLVCSVASGDIYPRPESEYNPESNYWANLSYVFKANGGSKYTLQLVNNMDASADRVNGNDLLFDDITISIRYPNVEVLSTRDFDQDKGNIATCDTGNVVLYALNRNGIKTYINNPVYLFQYRKSASEAWKNIDDAGVTSYDSIIINLTKTDERFFGYTYVRAIVASNSDVIDDILRGGTPTLSCSSVYAIDSSFVIYFGYQGAMGADYTVAECVGSEVTISGSAPKRVAYRWVDSKSGSVISENEESLKFVVDSVSVLPTDSLFYFVGVDSLGCTDTQKVTVHRKPIVQFAVPDSFIACYNASVVTLTDLVPATQSFAWSVNGYPSSVSTSASFPIDEPNAVLGSTVGHLTVTGSDDPADYCSNTKTFAYNIHYPIDVALSTDRSDTLFCLSQSDNKINFKATLTQGECVTYYWYADGLLVGSTNDPVNLYSFDITAGSHTYSVAATDGVCNVFGLSEAVTSMNIEARDPIVIALNSDKTVICEGESINLEASLDNVLINPTELTWTVTSNAAIDNAATFTGTDSKSTNVVTPTSTSDFAETFTVGVTTVDEVCPSNDPTRTIDLTLNKNLSIVLSAGNVTDRKCVAQEGDELVTLHIDVLRGNPVSYTWMDGYVSDAVDRVYSLSLGTNAISVSAVDGVCSGQNPEATSSMSIEARNPVVIELTSDKTVVCEGESINLAVKADNLLADPTDVIWSSSANAAVTSATTQTAAGLTSNVITPTSTTEFAEQFEVSATINDEVCTSNDPTKSLQFTLNKNMKILLSADGITDKKCIAAAGDEVANLHITVLRGNPTSYTWSDGLVSSELDRTYTLVLGQNVITVTADDQICSSAEPDATSNMDIKVRQPLSVEVSLASDNNPACVNSEVTLNAYIANLYGDDQAVLACAPDYFETKFVQNGNTQFSFFPPVGSNVITVYAVEAGDDPVCPVVNGQYTLYVQDSVKLAIEVPESFCQMPDGTGETTVTAIILQGDPIKLVWSTGEETINPSSTEELVVRPTESTYYSVYAVDAVCGNSNAAVSTNPVWVSTKVSVNLVAESDSVEINPTTSTGIVNLNATSDIPYTGAYSWFHNDIQFDGTAATNSVAEPMGTYTYRVEVDGGACGIIYSNDVTVEVGDFHVVPNAFTPRNSNPKNNVFMKGYEVEIYNRYQQLVHKGTDGWDGTYDGADAAPGTYFYRLYKKDGRVLKGTIELVKF